MVKRRRDFLFMLPNGKKIVVEHSVGNYAITQNTINQVRRLVK